ncbi:MAG TPA: VCBS domain-containing protein, partial [Sphingomicrobium sp.]|nr:VCBS domain-containing protein [Sphingomicrobium sp.]
MSSTTSFTHTPQAKDDNYAFVEDDIRSNSSLYDAGSHTFFLDVMANDLGGKAKSLFSVETGDGDPLTSDYELLSKDVGANGVSDWERTFNGNWIRIKNGKIEYKIADDSGIPGQGRSVDSLTAGEVFTDEFVYAIRLGNGTLSQATVKINITGANDAATITAAAGGDYAVTEAGGVGNGAPGDSSAGGTLVVSDADLGENKFQEPAAAALNGAYGTFTFDHLTGAWTYTIDNNRTATESLIQGQTVTETLTVTSHDGTATHTITVTVSGANDAPVAVADVGSAGENETKSFDVLANDTDVDAGDSKTLDSLGTVTVTSANGTVHGIDASSAFSIDGDQIKFTPGSLFDALDFDDTATVVVNYTMKDGQGASSSSSLTVTVSGANDAAAIAVDSTVTDDRSVSEAGGVANG